MTNLWAAAVSIFFPFAPFLGAQTQEPCPPPTVLNFEINNKVSRSQPGFTEGFVFHQGALYESTGQYGSSALQKIDPGSGTVTELAKLPAKDFGEGLAQMDDEWLQLTWKEKRALNWKINKEGVTSGTTQPYSHVGWGLTTDDEHWVASDGSDQIIFLNPSNLSTVGKLPVREGAETVVGLNELEWAGGSIWANVFPTQDLVRIDPVSGCVDGVLDLTKLRTESGGDGNRDSVANGIAYDPAAERFFLTGKNWAKIYVGKINEG